MSLPTDVRTLLADARDGAVVVLTGAGISAESGIPTFRGDDGYWTLGSRNYRPEEIATHAMFRAQPRAVWSWYLQRRAGCRDAAPNPAHRALADLEQSLGPRFTLVTQNIDGLHTRAGSSPQRTLEIHGCLQRVRCADACGQPPHVLPPRFDEWSADRELTEEESAALRCPRCSAWLRPHVLWFDEYYDEENFRFDSAVRATDAAALLLVVGTSGATNLPNLMCQRAAANGCALLVVNRDPSPFSALAERCARGAFVQGTASQWIPSIVDALVGRERPRR